MVNTDDFIKRLEQILDYYSLSASGFADKVGVQRSSLSHLLSGRNKPSLDFIMKIIDVFSEVDLYWILNGKGSFPINNFSENEKNEVQKTVFPPTPILQNQVQENLFEQSKNEKFEELLDTKKNETHQNISISTSQEEVEKIVIFYKNGKFSEYNPK